MHRCARLLVGAAATFLLAGCSLPPLGSAEPASVAIVGSPADGGMAGDETRPWHAFPDDALGWRAAAFWIPSLASERDLDAEDTIVVGSGGPSLDDGDGFGASLHAIGDVFGAGFLLLHTEHRERTFAQDVQVWVAGMEALAHKRFEPLPWLGIDPSLAAGFGGVRIDFQRGYEDDVEAAFLLRARCGVELFRHVEVAGSFGGLLYGRPGDTKGDATFATVELAFTLRF